MAGDYLQIDHELPDKPEFLGIIERTGADQATTFWLLFQLWRLFDRATEDGFLPHTGPRGLAARCGGDVAFWEAVADVGWLVFRDGGAEVPNFVERLGETARRRMKESIRKRKQRQAKADATRDSRGTAAGPEVGQSRDSSGTGGGTVAGPEVGPEVGQSRDRRWDSRGTGGGTGGGTVAGPSVSVSEVDHLEGSSLEGTSATSSVAQDWAKAADLAERTFWHGHPGGLTFPRDPFLLRVAFLRTTDRISEDALADSLTGMCRLRSPPKPEKRTGCLRSMLRRKVHGFEERLRAVPQPPAELLQDEE
jgi:hypothetical protein